MTRDEIRTVFLGALHRIAPEVDLETIAADRPIRDQIDLDSMDVLNLMIALSEKVGIEVPEGDYSRMTTLDQSVEYLLERQTASRSRS